MRKPWLIVPAVLGATLLSPFVNSQSGNGIPQQVHALEQQVNILQTQLKSLTQQVTSLQTALAAQGNPLWLVADCSNGGSINATLASAQGHAGPLGILVLGVCRESVYIDRSDTSIVGIGSDAAITPPRPGDSALSVFGANNFSVFRIALTGAGGNGLVAWQAHVNLSNVTITGSASSGIYASSGSAVTLNNVTLSENRNNAIEVLGARMDIAGGSIHDNFGGIQAVNNSSVSLQNGADISNNGGYGIMAIGTSSVMIGQATIENNKMGGISVQNGSSLLMGWAGSPGQILNNGGHGIILWDTSTADSNGGVVIQGNQGA